MPQHLHLDFETFSEIDLKDVGAYRYAFDPSTEILCAAMALDKETPEVWFAEPSLSSMFDPYWDALEDPEVLIYCHNAMFEMAICQALLYKTWGIRCPNLSRFRCTLSLARRAALPGKLEMLAIALGLTNQKDKKGKSLINKFSVMQKGKKPSKKNPEGTEPYRIRPQDDPVAFAEFMDYCRQDVIVEQEIAEKLAYFDDPINNANYSLDARINARGVTVNLQGLENAQKIVEEETELVSARFRELTGFEVTQNARLLEWCRERSHGCFDNLQAETISTFLEECGNADEVDDAVKALRMKQSIAYASIKKIPTMIECAGPHDNRIRGMLNHHGATTGRWTNSLVQFQNMKRPTIKDFGGEGTSEEAYRDICQGISRDMLECCYGPPLEVISSCVRHFVHDSVPTEASFLDADYAAIEARIVNWLAGQEDALEEYREGMDRYKVMASVIYGIDVADVNKFPQRFLGKTAILGCGFGMGPAKFYDSCKKMGYELPPGLGEAAIEAFRLRHPKVKQYWYDVEKAAKRAILNKGQMIELRNVAFLHADVAGTPFLLIRLPSGRKLAYPRPDISSNRITFYGHIQGVQWGRVETYGGKLVENITQAVAADLMANGAQKAEKAGYQIATLIHDQALAYFQEGQTVEEFVSLLTDLPKWAAGLPLEAEGGLVPFYKKD